LTTMTAGEMNAITSKLQELEGDISQSKETQKQYDARLKAAQVRAQSLPLFVLPCRWGVPHVACRAGREGRGPAARRGQRAAARRAGARQRGAGLRRRLRGLGVASAVSEAAALPAQARGSHHSARCAPAARTPSRRASRRSWPSARWTRTTSSAPRSSASRCAAACDAGPLPAAERATGHGRRRRPSSTR